MVSKGAVSPLISPSARLQDSSNKPSYRGDRYSPGEIEAIIFELHLPGTIQLMDNPGHTTPNFEVLAMRDLH